MRLAESKIKPAILHPDEEVRLAAVSYFSESRSDDPDIMPLVIKAVEKYGRGSAFSILRDAQYLPHTPATLDWVMSELRRDFRTRNIKQDNVRFALALVLLAAPTELLLDRQAEIQALPAFPDALRVPLADRLTLATWNSEQCWHAFQEFGLQNAKQRASDFYDPYLAAHLIEAVARFPKDREELVLEVISGSYAGPNKRLFGSRRREFIELAGEMRLETAVTALIWHLASLLSGIPRCKCAAFSALQMARSGVN